MDNIEDIFSKMLDLDLTKKDESVLKELPYEITYDRLTNEATKKIPDYWMTNYYEYAANGGKVNIQKIKDGIQKYPDVPQLYNYLYVAYRVSGKKKDSKKILKVIAEKFPNYLFGQISQAEEELNQKNYDKIPTILGKELELHAKYPDQKLFHASEINSYYAIVGLYYCKLENLNKAERCLNILENLSYSKETEKKQLKIELIQLRLKTITDRITKDKKRKISVNVISKKINKKPLDKNKLNNKICEELFNYYDNIPIEIITKIKQLPKETLIQDLINILADSIVCHKSYMSKFDDSENYENIYFPIHAIFLLTDIDDGSSLQDVLNIFRQDDEFIEFWFGDMFYQLAAYFIKFGYENLDILKSYLIEPNVLGSSKALIIESITKIALFNKSTKDEILNFQYSLIEYFYENRENKNLLDSSVLLALISAFIDLSDNKANDIIKKFFDMNIVPLMMFGDYEQTIVEIEREKDQDNSFEYTSYEDNLSKPETFDDNIWDNSSLNDSLPSVKKDQINDKKSFLPDSTPKLGRNDPCPCGSGKKYKKCCMNK